MLLASVPASPPPPSGSCFSSPKANCYTSYGCGRGPDTLIDKGRWSGGDDITRKSPRKSPAAPPQAHRGDRQTDRQTDTPQHPLGASRRPKNHAGFASRLSLRARTHVRAPVLLPPMPPTRSQEPAHRQRQASAAAKEAVSNDLRTHHKRHQAIARI